MTTTEQVARWRDLLPENWTGWECYGSVSICYQRVDALREALARLEAAEKVISDALDVYRPGASVPLGVSEARHFDRLLAEGHRILSSYTKGTDRD